MAYDPTKDFFGLQRYTPSGVEVARAPGLDIVLSALARAGLFKLYVGQSAPTTNQTMTAWLQPAQPSWTAEGKLWLWDAGVSAYAIATPALFFALLQAG